MVSHCRNISDVKSRFQHIHRKRMSPFIRPQALQNTQKRKTHQNMIPILPTIPILQSTVVFKEQFLCISTAFIQFHSELIQIEEGGGKWVISLCLVKELTHKKATVFEKAVPNLWRTCSDGFSIHLEEGKKQQHFPDNSVTGIRIQCGGTQESRCAVQRSCWGQWFIQCAMCQKQNV